jgi:hypothetical protein
LARSAVKTHAGKIIISAALMISLLVPGPYGTASGGSDAVSFVGIAKRLESYKEPQGYWRLIQESELVVQGVIQRPFTVVQRPDIRFSVLYESDIKVEQAMLGRPSEHVIRVSHFHLAGGATRDQLARLVGRKGIFFLQVAAHGALEEENGGYGFPGYSADEAIEYTPQQAAYISGLIEEQRRIIGRVDELFAREALPLKREVKQLITAALGPDEAAYRAKEKLFSLGLDAVPALIKHIDDRRRLAEPMTTVLQYPTAPTYAPKTAVDLVSLVLSAKTSGAYSWTKNGAPEPVRRRAVDYWKVWLGKAAGM